MSSHYGGYAGRLWRLRGKIRLCICVPYSFLNSYYHKLSENVWIETLSEQIVLDEKEAFYQMNCDKTLKIVLTKGIEVEPL